MPFCRTEHQNAFAKSSGVGTWCAGREGPKSLWRGVKELKGERRMLGVLRGLEVGGGDGGGSFSEFVFGSMIEEIEEAELPCSVCCSSSTVAGIGPLSAI